MGGRASRTTTDTTPTLMVLLEIDHLLLRQDDRDLLRVPPLVLREGWRVGLVGANGSGKSTLLAVLAGLVPPAEGRVLRPPGVRVALLSQAPTAPFDASLWELAHGELAALHALAEELERARRAAAAGHDDLAGVRYAETLSDFERRGGFTLEARLRAGLTRVGVPEPRWMLRQQHVASGERQRARLVGALTADTDVLLLDEPSNHLDFGGRDWLIETLRERRGAAVMASHDRALLSAVCTHVAWLEGGHLSLRRGSYADVVARSAAETRGHARRHAARVRRVAELERMAAELASHGHRGAQTRRRRAERERATLLEAAASSSAPSRDRRAGDRAAALSAGAAAPPPGVVLRARHLRIEGVLDDVSLELAAGVRVALVGPSGAGKSTLLALLAGELAADDPRALLDWRPGTSLLHLDQATRGLDPDVSPRGALEAWVSPQRAAAALAAASVPHRAWERPTHTLSGGEQARAALALLAVREADVILLDEPTADLDLPGIEALEAQLCASRATMVVVSQDEALLRALGAEVWALEAGALVPYRGGLDGYRRGARRLEPGAAEGRADDGGVPTEPAPADGGQPPSARRRLDDRLAALDAARQAADAALEDPTRLSERERDRWRQRRAEAEAATLAAYDEFLPPPEPRFRTLECGVPVHADRDGDGLVVHLAGGPGLLVRRIGTVAHLQGTPVPPGAPERSTLAWAWRALCRGAGRLACYLLPVEVVQVSSHTPLREPYRALGEGWWVLGRAELERHEGWLRGADAPRHRRRQRGRRPRQRARPSRR